MIATKNKKVYQDYFMVSLLQYQPHLLHLKVRKPTKKKVHCFGDMFLMTRLEGKIDNRHIQNHFGNLHLGKGLKRNKMKQTQILGNEFYQNLGKLFYYIAMADKSIRVEEVDKLKSFIRKYWLDVDEIEDEYGKDAAFQIEAVFNRLLEYETDSEDSFNEFKSFYTSRPEKFNSYIKVLILDTAHAISNTVYGKNKAELIALAKLQLLFQ